MPRHNRSLITAHFFSLLAVTVSACDSDDIDAQDDPAVEAPEDAALTGPPALVTPTEPTFLTTSSFLFQHHLLGSAYAHECDFDDLQCYVVGKYHTGLDDSATASTAIRASNFGNRSLVQNMSGSDHGMGNAVAVRYLLANGRYVYTTESHMSSHHPLSTRPDSTVAVPRGAKLGNVGGSGYGSLTYWGNHAHHEMKTGNTFAAPCNGTYWGYTPTSATNHCYVNPDDYIDTRRVLMPEFSLANAGWGDYDVLYGIVNTPIFSRIRLENSQESFANAGVRGHQGWSNTGVNFPMATNVPAGSFYVTSSRQFSAAGDYRLSASVQSNGEWRDGYPVIFSVLPKSSDFIRDNDMGAASFKGGGLGIARFDGYGYGANAATGNSGAWAQWYSQKTGNYRLWAYVGGNGVGTVRFKIYPTGSGNPIYSDPVNLSSAIYGWVQLRAGATTSWAFTSNGYVGLSADKGAANEVYLFDAIKFSAL